MARVIKGLKIEIGGDTTGLNDALKSTNSELKDTQKRLDNVNKALKMDPKNTELVAAKQRELNKAVELTQKRFQEANKAASEAKKQFEAGAITQEKYDEYVVTLAQLKGEFDSASKAAKDFEKSSSSLSQKLTEVSTSADQVASATKAVSTAGAAVVGAIGAAAIKSSEWADDLKTLSQQTGLTVEEIQKFEYASELVDVSTESITGALRKMTNNMASTSSTVTAAWDRLGISVTGVDGQMRNSTDVFYEALQALSQVRNETERDQLAMDLFGRSANELAGIIDDGGASLRAYGDEAERNGSIIESNLVDAMASFNDKIEAFKAAALPDLIRAGGAAIEAVTPLVESLITVISTLLSWLGNMDSTTIQVIGTIALFAASLSPIASGISAVSNAVNLLATGGLTRLVGMLGTTGGQMTAVIAIAGLLATLIMQIVNAWSDMSGWEKAISVFGSLVIAAAGAAIALGAVNSAATMGIAAAAIVAGIVAITAAVNSATKTKNDASSYTNAITTSSGSYGGGNSYATNNNYYNTTNNYGSRNANPVQINIDGKAVAYATYDYTQEISQNRGTQYGN